MAENVHGAMKINIKKKRKNRKSSKMNSFVLSEDEKSLREESGDDNVAVCDDEKEVDVEFNVVLIGKQIIYVFITFFFNLL